MVHKRIGILGLQGDFALHDRMLHQCYVQTKIIKWPDDLNGCDGLILPGGESTTFIKLLGKTGLFEALKAFAQTHPIMGTCAGLIALATSINNCKMETLGLIEMEVERNAYGRQVDSFIEPIRVSCFKENPEFEGVFIRAPKIIGHGNNTEALGFHKNDLVMARNQNVLVTTFHPELTKDKRIHTYFIENFF